MNATDANKYLQEIEKDYREDCLSRGLDLDCLVEMMRTPLIIKAIARIETESPSEENSFHSDDYIELLSGTAQTGSFNTMGVALGLYRLGANPLGILEAASNLILAIELENFGAKFFKEFLN